ncbi:MAG: hypothetical protein WC125_05740 [Bacteroidales bacterium]|jgi:predicted restriction endonuclease
MDHNITKAEILHTVENLHCAVIRGQVIVAKPVFILALIQGIEDGTITINKFVWDRKDAQYRALYGNYKSIFSGYLPGTYMTPIYKPFVHLSTDKLWILNRRQQSTLPDHAYGAFLKDDFTYAELQGIFWEMLNNYTERETIKELILNKYIRTR